MDSYSSDTGAISNPGTVYQCGPGIGAHEIDAIFDKFYRSKQAVHQGIQGTGLGLALVQQLLNLMGGQITASSNDGETHFEIWLPNEGLKQ
ncbi:ATP-binding protein [Leptolyngbya sp. FACHB-261]|uniref:sensor histidine kinase n=1 Tax=Leptolyngbya sp. FACHB-261 TaxID=2692806 RepID=UPI00168845DD|nr:ATP-binding protein [Leptolyngbya sp. FACHB-261]